MNPADNERFTQFLRESAEKTRRLGYTPNQFVKMINTEGGHETAKRLLGKPHPSPGFVELYSLGHPELTVEALILESKWVNHFDEELLISARKRLLGIRYNWIPSVANESAESIVKQRLEGSTSVAGTFPLAGTRASAPSVLTQGLSAAIQRVLHEYLSAARKDFRRHPLASFIRGELANLVLESVDATSGTLLIKASAGQGVWARGPWVGIFNPIVTNAASRGYYVSLLFREDMAGVYLSLNQAMTEAKDNYKADAKTALRARAANFRALLGDRKAFPLLKIDLAPSSQNNDTAFYEAGNIFAKYYSRDNLPSDHELKDDLHSMLDVYDALIVSETALATPSESDLSETDGGLCEDPSRFRMHRRIERNPKLVERVKKLKGCTCEACGMNFADRYGELGAGYIEAHHLKPIATLDKVRVAMDPKQDFAVLCANCHRMIHRSEDVSNVAHFRAKYVLPGLK